MMGEQERWSGWEVPFARRRDLAFGEEVCWVAGLRKPVKAAAIQRAKPAELLCQPKQRRTARSEGAKWRGAGVGMRLFVSASFDEILRSLGHSDHRDERGGSSKGSLSAIDERGRRLREGMSESGVKWSRSRGPLRSCEEELCGEEGGCVKAVGGEQIASKHVASRSGARILCSRKR